MKAFLILFLGAAFAFASPPERQEPQKAEDQRQTRQLQRDPASEIDEDVYLTINSDGSKQYSGTLKIPAGVTKWSGGYNFGIDPVRRTVKLTALPSDDTEIGVDPEEKVAPPTLPEWDDDGCICALPVCSGTIKATIRSTGPGGVAYSKTEATGGWRRYENLVTEMCNWYSTGGLVTGYAANPAADNTHWTFAVPTARYGPYSSPDGRWEMKGVGQYKNWDFITPNYATWTADTIIPQINNGSVTVPWTHGDTGEGTSYINGSVGAVISNTCTQ